jgi:hypothetical protein
MNGDPFIQGLVVGGGLVFLAWVLFVAGFLLSVKLEEPTK